MISLLIHLPAEPVGGVLQVCARCGIVLLDFTEERSYPIGQDPTPRFWQTGAPILRSLDGGFTAALAVLKDDRSVDDEAECEVAS